MAEFKDVSWWTMRHDNPTLPSSLDSAKCKMVRHGTGLARLSSKMAIVVVAVLVAGARNANDIFRLRDGNFVLRTQFGFPIELKVCPIK